MLEGSDAGAPLEIDYDRGWREWGDMIRWSPAPFHRRRLMLRLAEDLSFDSVLDVGCGNGEVLLAFRYRHPHAALTGVDLSAEVIERNAALHSDMRFYPLDLAVGALPERADLVLCTEVIEHIDDWRLALKHLREMCGGHLIVTVPAGRVFPIDREMGHVRHFSPTVLVDGLRSAGFRADTVWQWGFPFHTIYKSLINLAPSAAMNGFGKQEYGLVQKGFAAAVSATFYLNRRQSRWGRQLIVRAVAL